jgi:hypothetical protein
MSSITDMTDVNDLYWLTTIAVQENANSKYMKGQFMKLCFVVSISNIIYR